MILILYKELIHIEPSVLLVNFSNCYESQIQLSVFHVIADVLVLHRLQHVTHSPGPGPQPAGRNSPGNPVTSMVSTHFICPAILGSWTFQTVFL